LINKRELYLDHQTAFSDSSAMLHQPPETLVSNHWLNLLLMDNQQERDALLKTAHDKKIFLRPLWNPMHQLSMYNDVPRDDLTMTETIWAQGVCLPSSPSLQFRQA